MRKRAANRFIPLSISVTPERHDALRDLATHCDTSVSAIVNTALDDLLADAQKRKVQDRLSERPLRS